MRYPLYQESFLTSVSLFGAMLCPHLPNINLQIRTHTWDTILIILTNVGTVSLTANSSVFDAFALKMMILPKRLRKWRIFCPKRLSLKLLENYFNKVKLIKRCDTLHSNPLDRTSVKIHLVLTYNEVNVKIASIIGKNARIMMRLAICLIITFLLLLLPLKMIGTLPNM